MIGGALIMALTGYLFADGNAAGAVAESKDGAGLASLGALAVRFQATIVCGYAERGRGRLYNSARIIGPDGQLVYNYRKRLLYDSDLTQYPVPDAARRRELQVFRTALAG